MEFLEKSQKRWIKTDKQDKQHFYGKETKNVRFLNLFIKKFGFKFVSYFYPIRIPDYPNYIRARKTPSEQKALTRERKQAAINKQHKKQLISLDHPRRSFTYETDEMLHVSSPIIEGDIAPKPASQRPSQILPYVQSETLVGVLNIILILIF